MEVMVYRYGSRGEAVKQIQKALKGAGLGVVVDGIYGEITKSAIEEFQRKNGLKVDGICGPATLAKLLPIRWKRTKRPIKEIIVHCSATPEGKNYTVADIRNWHKQRGFSDIGYHYVIYRDGAIIPGRDIDLIGAHCAKGGHNTYSIGICYIGGMTRDNKQPKDTRTLAQKAALTMLIQDLKFAYPGVKVYGHHDFDNMKECPCFDAKAEYKNV